MKPGLGPAAGLLLVLVLALFAGAEARAAGGVIASDGFGRTVSGGWGSADVGGAWTVLDSAASWSVSPGAGSVSALATAQRRAVLSGVSVQDVDVLAKVASPRCSGAGHYCNAYLLGRVSAGSDPSYYRVGVVNGPGSGDILIRTQRSDGTFLGGDLDTGIPAADGTQVMLRVEFQGVNPTAIRARAWAVGTSEPSTWLLNITDAASAMQVGGAVGVRMRNEDTAAAHTFALQSYQATALSLPPPPAPSISGFTPSSGLVGSTVTITGSYFSGASGVSFGGTSASGFVVNSDSQISATVPAGASSGPISVTTPNGTGTSAASFTVSSPSAPSISGFTPSGGPVGTSVTISGSYFSGATGVSFGGTNASGFVVNSDSQISVTVPAGASSGQISVTTPNGTGTSAASFTVSSGGVQVASDSFGRSVSGGWGSADVGGAWSILDSAASWSVSPGSGSVAAPATVQRRAVLSGVSVQDVDLLAKVKSPRCSGAGHFCNAYLLGRVSTGSDPSYYRVGVAQGPENSDIVIRTQRSDGTYLVSDVDTGIPAADGAQVMLRVEFQGVNPTAIRARAWAVGTTEPSAWLVNVTDAQSAEQVTGAIGVRLRNEDTAAAHTFALQSFQATALPPPPPPAPIAVDSFARTVPSGWANADTGGWWTVVGSPWNWSTSAGAGSVAVGAASEERAYLSSFTVQDVDVVEKVVLPKCNTNNCDAFVLGRYSPAYSPTYYRVGVVQGASGTIRLRAQRDDGTNLASDLDTGIPAADGAQVMLRVQFQGANPTVIRARVWKAGAAEPTSWLLNTTDSTSAEQQAGMLGVRLKNEDGGSAHTFQITSLQATGSATPVTATPNPTGPAHWLYAVNDGRVYVYDIDSNHTLVKQFPIPEQGKRGVMVDPGRKLLYVTECGSDICAGNHGSLLAYDLVHDNVAWIANYSFGTDQGAITPNGSTIYMAHGEDATDGQTSILDASNGKPTGTITTGTNGHNTIVSLDGTQAYLTGLTGSNYNFAHVVNTATNQVTMNAGPTINGIRPFTVNGKHTMMFTTSTNTCGFQVLSLVTGAVLYTVPFGGSCVWNGAGGASNHGISLAPDEHRVYIIDGTKDVLEVYDVSGLPASAPTFVAAVPLSSLAGNESSCQTFCGREGWVLNDLSGRYVYVADTGDVVSTSTLSIVTTLPALRNTRLVIEVDWQNGAPSGTSTRFGLGRVTN